MVIFNLPRKSWRCPGGWDGAKDPRFAPYADVATVSTFFLRSAMIFSPLAVAREITRSNFEFTFPTTESYFKVCSCFILWFGSAPLHFLVFIRRLGSDCHPRIKKIVGRPNHRVHGYMSRLCSSAHTYARCTHARIHAQTQTRAHAHTHTHTHTRIRTYTHTLQASLDSFFLCRRSFRPSARCRPAKAAPSQPNLRPTPSAPGTSSIS